MTLALTLHAGRCHDRVSASSYLKARIGSAFDAPWRAGSLRRGLLVHIAGQSEKGFRVVDVWESEDAFRRFGES